MDQKRLPLCAIRNLVFPWVPLKRFYSPLSAIFNGWPLTETGKDHFASPPCLLLDLRVFLPSTSSMQAARLDYSTLNANATTCTTKPTTTGLPTTTITTAAVAYVALLVKWKWRSPSCSTHGTTSHYPSPRCPRSTTRGTASRPPRTGAMEGQLWPHQAALSRQQGQGRCPISSTYSQISPPPLYLHAEGHHMGPTLQYKEGQIWHYKQNVILPIASSGKKLTEWHRRDVEFYLVARIWMAQLKTVRRVYI